MVKFIIIGLRRAVGHQRGVGRRHNRLPERRRVRWEGEGEHSRLPDLASRWKQKMCHKFLKSLQIWKEIFQNIICFFYKLECL
jgi:hypothetical protein